MTVSVDIVVEKVEPTLVEPSIEVMTGVVSESSGGSSTRQMGEVSGDVSTFDEALGDTEVLDDGRRQWYHQLREKLSSFEGEGHISTRGHFVAGQGARGHKSGLYRVGSQVGLHWGTTGFPDGTTRGHVGASYHSPLGMHGRD